MDIGHLITIVLAAGGALAGAIGVMYKTIMQLHNDQSDIREELGHLKGKQDGIEHLSSEVLQTVHDALRSKKKMKVYMASDRRRDGAAPVGLHDTRLRDFIYSWIAKPKRLRDTLSSTTPSTQSEENMPTSKSPLRAILVHGYNVKDGGAGTTDALRPLFEAAGYEVLEFDTGWRGLFMVRFGNAKRARRLARMIKPGDLLIGHSDGCNLINLASWNLANGSRPTPKLVAYVNPALDRDTQLAPQIDGAIVCHTPSDNVVKVAKLLPFHNWGSMGAYGYAEKDPSKTDVRYLNASHESMGVENSGHSGVLKGSNKDLLVKRHLGLRLR